MEALAIVLIGIRTDNLKATQNTRMCTQHDSAPKPSRGLKHSYYLLGVLSYLFTGHCINPEMNLCRDKSLWWEMVSVLGGLIYTVSRELEIQKWKLQMEMHGVELTDFYTKKFTTEGSTIWTKRKKYAPDIFSTMYTCMAKARLWRLTRWGSDGEHLGAGVPADHTPKMKRYNLSEHENGLGRNKIRI